MSEVLRAKPLRIQGAGNTHIGGREHNEDTILLRPDLDLYMVADGAGGHNAGNIASTLAASTVAHYFESTQAEAESQPPYDAMGLPHAARRLATAFQHANREVIDVAETSEHRKGMGTTLVAAYFDLTHAMLVLGHVGDSRCYRLRDGRLERLTQDHTLVNDVLEMKPDIDPSTAAKLPRNVITNALGMERNLRVSVRTHEVAPGDRYLLCSDGLTDQVDDGEIQQALQLGGGPEEQMRLLIDLAADGGRDNIAVVVLACSLAPGVGRLPEKPVPPRRAYPQKSIAGDPGDAVIVLEEEEEHLDEHVIEISGPHEQPQPPAQQTHSQQGAPARLFEESSPALVIDEEAYGHVQDDAIPYSPLQNRTPPPPPPAIEPEPVVVAAAPAVPVILEADDDEPEVEISESKPAHDLGKSRKRRPDETIFRKGRR